MTIWHSFSRLLSLMVLLCLQYFNSATIAVLRVFHLSCYLRLSVPSSESSSHSLSFFICFARASSKSLNFTSKSIVRSACTRFYIHKWLFWSRTLHILTSASISQHLCALSNTAYFPGRRQATPRVCLKSFSPTRWYEVIFTRALG